MNSNGIPMSLAYVFGELCEGRSRLIRLPTGPIGSKFHLKWLIEARENQLSRSLRRCILGTFPETKGISSGSTVNDRRQASATAKGNSKCGVRSKGSAVAACARRFRNVGVSLFDKESCGCIKALRLTGKKWLSIVLRDFQRDSGHPSSCRQINGVFAEKSGSCFNDYQVLHVGEHTFGRRCRQSEFCYAKIIGPTFGDR